MASGQDMMSGVVDPELLYTKQNCIGMLFPARPRDYNAYSTQAVAALEKSTRGKSLSPSIL